MQRPLAPCPFPATPEVGRSIQSLVARVRSLWGDPIKPLPQCQTACNKTPVSQSGSLIITGWPDVVVSKPSKTCQPCTPQMLHPTQQTDIWVSGCRSFSRPFRARPRASPVAESASRMRVIFPTDTNQFVGVAKGIESALGAGRLISPSSHFKGHTS